LKRSDNFTYNYRTTIKTDPRTTNNATINCCKPSFSFLKIKNPNNSAQIGAVAARGAAKTTPPRKMA